MDSAAAWPDMSEAIPIFPLAGAMLLPYGRLPLNVFEPRYLALVDDALAAGRLFGMIQPDASKPETRPAPRCSVSAALAASPPSPKRVMGACSFH